MSLMTSSISLFGASLVSSTSSTYTSSSFSTLATSTTLTQSLTTTSTSRATPWLTSTTLPSSTMASTKTSSTMTSSTATASAYMTMSTILANLSTTSITTSFSKLTSTVTSTQMYSTETPAQIYSTATSTQMYSTSTQIYTTVTSTRTYSTATLTQMYSNATSGPSRNSTTTSIKSIASATTTIQTYSTATSTQMYSNATSVQSLNSATTSVTSITTSTWLLNSTIASTQLINTTTTSVLMLGSSVVSTPSLNATLLSVQHASPTINSSLISVTTSAFTAMSTIMANSSGQSCGGSYNTLEGVILSPCYPNNVTENTTCIWNITLPANLTYIRLKMQKLLLNSDGLLRLYDQHSNVLRNITGPITNNAVDVIIWVHSIRAEFSSGGKATNPFRLSWNTFDGIYNTTSITETITINSPNFPSSIAGFVTLQWVFNTTKDYWLYVTSSNLELMDNASLVFTDLSSNNTLLQIQNFSTSTDNSFSHMLESSRMRMVFNSGTNESSAFQLNITNISINNVSSFCGGSQGLSGGLMSPGYPNLSPKFQTCYWEIKTQNSSFIQLDQNSLILDNSSKIFFRDGNSNQTIFAEPTILKVGKKLVLPTNHLRVKYTTGSLASSKFAYNWSYFDPTNTTCSFSYSPFQIETVSYPSRPFSFSFCMWKLKAPQKNYVKLNISSLNMGTDNFTILRIANGSGEIIDTYRGGTNTSTSIDLAYSESELLVSVYHGKIPSWPIKIDFQYIQDPYCNPKCPQNAFCKDKKFKFICQCDQGYEEYKEVCIDVNECRNGSHNCDKQAQCHNQEGSFTCSCNLGYKGNGTRCKLDTCPYWKICPERSTCVEDVGCICHGGHRLLNGVCRPYRAISNVKTPTTTSNYNPSTNKDVFVIIYSIFAAIFLGLLLSSLVIISGDKLNNRSSVSPSPDITLRTAESPLSYTRDSPPL